MKQSLSIVGSGDINMPSDYTVIKMSPDDLNTVYYDIYCKNNSIKIDGFDEPVLSADQHYSKEDFLEIISDAAVFSYIAFEKVFLKQPNEPGHYVGKTGNGFLCFERKADKVLSIVFWEAANDKVDVYEYLLNFLYEKAYQKGHDHKIEIEIQDGRWSQIKAALNVGFKREKTVVGKDGAADIYIYSKKIKQL